MKRKRISKRACFAMGTIGAVLYMGAGTLMLFGLGAAMFLRMAAFALMGAMLLFIALAEFGPENRKARIYLLVLFFVWMLSYIQEPNYHLPPLSEICGAVVPILFTAKYRQGRFAPLWLALVAAELAQAVLLTLSIMPWYGTWHNYVVGGAIALAGLLRAAMLGTLYRHQPRSTD